MQDLALLGSTAVQEEECCYSCTARPIEPKQSLQPARLAYLENAGITGSKFAARLMLLTMLCCPAAKSIW